MSFSQFNVMTDNHFVLQTKGVHLTYKGHPQCDPKVFFIEKILTCLSDKCKSCLQYYSVVYENGHSPAVS